MKVWIVESWDDYESSEIISAFDTEQEAAAEVSRVSQSPRRYENTHYIEIELNKPSK